MSGLFRRIRRTRAAAAEESRFDPPAPGEPQDATTPAEHSGGQQPLGWSGAGSPASAPPAEQPPLAELRDLPAGLEVEELRSPRLATERRSRLRRRTRYLRRVRELLLRDLGGLVYEIQRARQAGDPSHHESLVRAKAQRLAALDAELYALENRLGSAHPETVLREPGVGGACPSCGELHSSDARFCSACGTSLTGRPAEAPADDAPVEAAVPPTESEAPTEVQTPDEPPRDADDRRPDDDHVRFAGNGRGGADEPTGSDLATPAERPS